ncbi:MAG: AAA family ATPase [Deltaproteobacteria bacterium]|nr:AAA family ATPase [Deltaproteobacteria bacterium]
MYKNFFGFKERPFQLVPNPAYLYLSRGHEEALAHLTYAISQGDGFVEITGEVGTGKTTLCRAFLENLGEKGTEAAFIFNPKLDAVHLLKAINDEFGIDSSADNIKDLIDTLNEFLLRKKAEGHKVLLLIDEAQNLSKDVLEQLRLLSNLETTTSKLLQIILVGQPELGEMLDSHDLRQLGQRITLSCHLSPLSFRETREYILHRLRVASRKEVVQFTPSAMHAVYHYSGGIPRLINIACDRALLTAFGLNRRKVTAGIARSAVRELADRRSIQRTSLGRSWRPWLAAAVVVLAFAAAGLYLREGGEEPSGLKASTPDPGSAADSPGASTPPPEAPRRAEPPPDPAEASAPAEEPVRAEMGRTAAVEKAAVVPRSVERAETPEDLDRYLAGVDAMTSRRTALRAVLALWSQNPVLSPYLDDMEQGGDVFEFAAKQNELDAHLVRADLRLLEKLNVPAVLRMSIPGGVVPRYVTLSNIRGDEVTLRGGTDADNVIHTRIDVLYSRWTGEAYLFWKNFLNCEGTIPIQADRESVITLKMLLQDIGFENVEVTPYWDEQVRDAVEAVQRRNGIKVDGIVGPVTKIVLYNEKKDLEIPHIVDEFPGT